MVFVVYLLAANVVVLIPTQEKINTQVKITAMSILPHFFCHIFLAIILFAYQIDIRLGFDKHSFLLLNYFSYHF